LRYLFEELPKASTAEALEALLPWNVKAVLQARQRAAAAYSTAMYGTIDGLLVLSGFPARTVS
jgi:hypothetical protein